MHSGGGRTRWGADSDVRKQTETLGAPALGTGAVELLPEGTRADPCCGERSRCRPSAVLVSDTVQQVFSDTDREHCG